MYRRLLALSAMDILGIISCLLILGIGFSMTGISSSSSAASSASSSSTSPFPNTSLPPAATSSSSTLLSSSSSSSASLSYERRGKSAFLRRELLKNTSVTCNDGTTAGYYIRPSGTGSKRWIVFLEGGWHCFSPLSCHQRWIRARPFMTSAHWPQMRSMGGILSLNSEENPYWWDANHVLIPYCSSDSWSGDSPSKNAGEFSFLGSRIVSQVLIELLPQGLQTADLLFLTGSSAGAAGVLVNLDRVAELMVSVGSTAQVLGIADSGWFLDNKPFDEFNRDGHHSQPSSQSSSSNAAHDTSCQNSRHNCPPVEGIKLAINMWNGQVPTACRSEYPNEPWRCYFGYRIYPTLKTPVFIVQWIFDEAQMTIDNVGNPVSRAHWNYIHTLGLDLKKSLENVTALFAPSCVSHTLLTKRSWTQMRINYVSLPEALRCWEMETTERHTLRRKFISSVALSNLNRHLLPHDNKNGHHHRNENQPRSVFRRTSIAPSASESDAAKTDPTTDPFVIHLDQIPGVVLSPVSSSSENNKHTNIKLIEEKTSRRRKRKRKHNNRHNRHHVQNYNQKKGRKFAYGKYCRHHFMDSCSWPQCNRACPTLYNPLTGKEMDFIQLFKSLGLNMSMVADALGIDIYTLNGMDHDSLLHLLSPD